MKHGRKVCRECGAEKHLGQFYRCKQNVDGHMGKCKECHKRYVNENRELKREHYASKRREYLADPVNRARHYERIRRWRQTERGKAIMAEGRKVWNVCHPEHYERIKRANWRRQTERRKQMRAEARA